MFMPNIDVKLFDIVGTIYTSLSFSSRSLVYHLSAARCAVV